MNKNEGQTGEMNTSKGERKKERKRTRDRRVIKVRRKRIRDEKETDGRKDEDLNSISHMTLN